MLKRPKSPRRLDMNYAMETSIKVAIITFSLSMTSAYCQDDIDIPSALYAGYFKTDDSLMFAEDVGRGRAVRKYMPLKDGSCPQAKPETVTIGGFNFCSK